MRRKKTKKSPDLRWWRAETDDDAAALMVGAADRIAADDAGRIAKIEALQTMFEDQGDADEVRPNEIGLRPAFRKRDNIVYNAVDMVESWVTKSELTPWVMTTGGDVMLQMRAEALSMFLRGVWDETGAKQQVKWAFRDSILCGIGYVKIVPVFSSGRIVVERKSPCDVFVDERERKSGSVRTLYERSQVDRAVLTEMFPEAADIIEEAPESESDDTQATESDLVDVWEAWRLPSSRDSGDGRHIIACSSGGLLVADTWEHGSFPFVKISYGSRVSCGWYGMGLGERIVGTQNELNWVSQKNSEAFASAAPKIITYSGAAVAVKDITNSPYQLLDAGNAMPGSIEWVTPAAIHPQQLEREQSLISRAFEINGLSSAMATGQTTEALANSSGKALMVHAEMQGGRLFNPSEVWQDAHPEAYKLIIRAAEDLTAHGSTGHLRVLVEDEGMLRDLSFHEVTIEEDSCRIKVAPISALSVSPSGRLDEVDKLIERGLVTDREQALELINMPDLKRFNDRELSPRRYVERQVMNAIRDGKQPVADPILPIAQSIDHARKLYLWAREQNTPEDRLSLVRDFIAMLQAEQVAQMPPQPEPQPSGPPPMPAPVPMSPEGMMPNV